MCYTALKFCLQFQLALLHHGRDGRGRVQARGARVASVRGSGRHRAVSRGRERHRGRRRADVGGLPDPGRVVIENENTHSTDAESPPHPPPPPPPCVCISIHPDGESCGHVRYRFDCVFSMTFLPGGALHVRRNGRTGQNLGQGGRHERRRRGADGLCLPGKDASHGKDSDGDQSRGVACLMSDQMPVRGRWTFTSHRTAVGSA